MDLSVELLGRDFQRVVLPDVGLAVDWLRWAALGGSASGPVGISGGGAALLDCLGWLRRPVVARSTGGAAVWWGFVWGVHVRVGGYGFGIGLEGMANRVRVRYTDSSTGTETVTSLADNLDSQSLYGVVE